MKSSWRSFCFLSFLLCAFALLPALLLSAPAISFADEAAAASDLAASGDAGAAAEAELGDTVQTWLERIFIGIGICSAIVKALEAIAGITPSTKDDHYVGLAKRILGHAAAFLSAMALNPRQPSKPSRPS